MGIDLGVKELAVVSYGDDSYVFHNINKSKRVRKLEHKKKHIQRVIARKYSSTNGGELTPTIIDGRVVDKPEVCDGLLPAQSGFFFGSTDYDESYMADILQTIKHIAEILVETDFETDAVYYLSSW